MGGWLVCRGPWHAVRHDSRWSHIRGALKFSQLSCSSVCPPPSRSQNFGPLRLRIRPEKTSDDRERCPPSPGNHGWLEFLAFSTRTSRSSRHGTCCLVSSL